MLLHYIIRGLPELDVHDVQQRRMDIFFRDLLKNERLRKRIASQRHALRIVCVG